MTVLSQIARGLISLGVGITALAQSESSSPSFPPTPVPASPAASDAVFYTPTILPEPPRLFSFYDGQGLTRGQFGFAVGSGFPLTKIEASYGLIPRVSVIASFDTFYGEFWQPGLAVKINLITDGITPAAAQNEDPSRATLALQLGASYTYFMTPELQEDALPPTIDHASRWATGQRNAAANALLILSFHGLRNIPVHFAVGLEATFDTTPLPSGPLAGPAPAFSVGYNVPFRIGAEIPISRNLNFFGMVGFDLHTRPEDSSVMPFGFFGVTFATPGSS